MVSAKPRQWTQAEVQEAIAAVKNEPGLWAELEEIEKTTGDLTDTEAGLREQRILARLHPGCRLIDDNELYAAVRLYRLAKLGLE
jgi:hypothetical protein